MYTYFFYEYQIIYSNGVVNGTLCKNFYDDISNQSGTYSIKYHQSENWMISIITFNTYYYIFIKSIGGQWHI